MSDSDAMQTKQRQVIYWRLLAMAFGREEMGKPFEDMVREIARNEEMPAAVLDPHMGIETLLSRHPELKASFDKIKEITATEDEDEGEGEDEDEEAEDGDDSESHATSESDESDEEEEDEGDDEVEVDLERTLAFSKVLLNVFGPNARGSSCSAKQYSQWKMDAELFGGLFGLAPTGSAPPGEKEGGPGTGPGGKRRLIDDEQLREELIAMESDMIQRMDLREVLQDDQLAKRITPTAAVVEQLLYDKSNLSGKAMANARALIRKYVDDLAEVLKKQVKSTSTGKIDFSVPPKRVFRNLDLKRTLWKNLPNYNPEDGRIYVDQLFYRHTAQSQLNNYLIVVVDQSGSMVREMTQCAILASIFASLPRVKVTMIAYDTSVINLTEYVHDPFEALMRTNLGGGTDGAGGDA